MNEPQKNGVVLKKQHIIIGSICIVVLIIGAMVLGLNWNNWFGKDTPTGPDIDSNAAAWSESNLQNKDGGSSTGIAIPGYPSITFPADTTDVQITLLNPKGNPCYFTFEIVLKDYKESLYTSKQVPPGQAITNITLARGLPAGQYAATIKISTTSLSDGKTPMNGANVETKIIVN